VPLGDGKSGFIPPQPLGGTVAWRFDNVSGVLETCSLVDPAQVLSVTNIRDCSGRSQLLTGFVNFASNGRGQATANNAMRPRGTPFSVAVQVQRTFPSALLVDNSNGCFTGTAAFEGRSYVEYFCAVPVSLVAKHRFGRVTRLSPQPSSRSYQWRGVLRLAATPTRTHAPPPQGSSRTSNIPVPTPTSSALWLVNIS
jgi:hypothetical protein